jgi:hypothetical protein
MIPVPSPVEGVTIEHDASSGRWRLHAGAASTMLRPWTWGERRRLLGASTITGSLNRSVFIHSLFDLLLADPVPQVEPASLAVVCLYLLGVPENGQVLPLTRAEFLAATTLGWSPQQIDTQPADDIDRLIVQIEPQAGGAVDEGWTRIVIKPDESSSIGGRLEAMLMTIARLAGVIEAAVGAKAPPVVARDAIAALPLAPPPRKELPREEPVELAFGGIARLKRRDESAYSKRAIAGVSVAPPLDDTTGTATQAPIPEPKIARVASRFQARSDASLLARTLPPPDAVAAAAPASHAHAVLTPDAPAPSHAPAQTAVRVSRYPSRAEVPAAPSPRSVTAADPVAARVRATPAPVAVSSVAVQPPEPLDFFPTFRATVQWPEASGSIGSSGQASFRSPDALPAAPFQLSDLEEQIADVLDRAAREAGIDLP